MAISYKNLEISKSPQFPNPSFRTFPKYSQGFFCYSFPKHHFSRSNNTMILDDICPDLVQYFSWVSWLVLLGAPGRLRGLCPPGWPLGVPAGARGHGGHGQTYQVDGLLPGNFRTDQFYKLIISIIFCFQPEWGPKHGSEQQLPQLGGAELQGPSGRPRAEGRPLCHGRLLPGPLPHLHDQVGLGSVGGMSSHTFRSQLTQLTYPQMRAFILDKIGEEENGQRDRLVLQGFHKCKLSYWPASELLTHLFVTTFIYVKINK